MIVVKLSLSVGEPFVSLLVDAIVNGLELAKLPLDVGKVLVKNSSLNLLLDNQMLPHDLEFLCELGSQSL